MRTIAPGSMLAGPGQPPEEPWRPLGGGPPRTRAPAGRTAAGNQAIWGGWGSSSAAWGSAGKSSAGARAPLPCRSCTRLPEVWRESTSECQLTSRWQRSWRLLTHARNITASNRACFLKKLINMQEASPSRSQVKGPCRKCIIDFNSLVADAENSCSRVRMAATNLAFILRGTTSARSAGDPPRSRAFTWTSHRFQMSLKQSPCASIAACAHLVSNSAMVRSQTAFLRPSSSQRAANSNAWPRRSRAAGCMAAGSLAAGSMAEAVQKDRKPDVKGWPGGRQPPSDAD